MGIKVEGKKTGCRFFIFYNNFEVNQENLILKGRSTKVTEDGVGVKVEGKKTRKNFTSLW